MKHFLLPLLTVVSLCTALALCTAPASAKEKNYLVEDQATRDARMQWWREARFGMFIHWGPYAVPAGVHGDYKFHETGEWIQNNAKISIADYEKYARQFNPVDFDARKWVQLASDAGMKYLVITTKHHDGFCLWDSKLTDYDLVDFTPFERDVLEELAVECKKAGIKLCFYHSILDWHHPDAQAIFEPIYNSRSRKESNPHFARYVDEYMRPQLKELVERYDPAVMWFDGEWVKDWTEPQGKALYNELRNLKPSIIVNNRVGKGRKGMQGFSKDTTYAGDFGTPEQEIPDQGLPGIDWESCMTMNGTWGYIRHDDQWKSNEKLIRNLIDIVSKGGNFLLNVGPTAEGVIPQPSVERLQAMGRWMRVNSEAIYGAAASPLKKPTWGRYTSKPDKLYAHVFAWPTDGKLVVEAKDLPLARAYLLASPEIALEVTKNQGQLTITLPATTPDAIASVVVLQKSPK